MEMMSAFYPLGDILAISARVRSIPNGDTRLGIMVSMKTKPIREILADNVRAFMGQIDAVSTQVKLAKRAGVAQSSVNRVLGAQVDTQIGVVEALASAFGVPAGALLIEHGHLGDDIGAIARKIATLSADDRKKVEAFVDFVHSSARENASRDTGELDATVSGSEDERSTARRAAQRPLSNQSLSIDPHDNSNKSDQRIRRSK